MRAFINDTEYRLLDDYELEETAGSTSVMTASVDIDDNPEPKPFDNIKFYSDNIDIIKDVINKSGITDGVSVENQTLLLDKVENTTYGHIKTHTWGDFIW